MDADRTVWLRLMVNVYKFTLSVVFFLFFLESLLFLPEDFTKFLIVNEKLYLL